jgi:hypothetical protein
MSESPDGNVERGLQRQRLALVTSSIALIVFQEIGAKLDRIEIFGNSVALAKPLPVTAPLWIAWAYFSLRYYQYFRDLADTGYRSSVEQRLRDLARAEVLNKLRKTVTPNLGEPLGGRASWTVELSEALTLIDTPPKLWRVKASGWINIVDRDRPNWGTTQRFQDIEVVLPPGRPRFARLRANIWALVHTRRGTEYVLPFLLGALPLLIAILHAIGFHLIRITDHVVRGVGMVG